MVVLTDLTSYTDAQQHFSKENLWALFDGDRERLNIGHECVDRHPADRIAIRIAHANGRDETITFGELRDWSNRVAHWLAGKGVGEGERVAIMLEPSLAFYAVLFGAMKAGCVAVPLFTLFGPDGLALRIDDCAPSLLVLAPEKADLQTSANVPVVIADDALLAELTAQSTAFTPDTAADAMAMYQYTSGTTRQLPEAVKHRHRAVVTVAIAALYATGVRPWDHFMCPSSPAWGHGLWHGTLAPLSLGVSIAAYAGPFDAERLMRAIQDYKITNLSAAATHYRMMKQAGTADEFDFNLQKLTFTGEAMDGGTADWVNSTFGQHARSIYGSTEVGVILAGYPGADDFDFKPGSLGKPVPSVEVAVLRADGEPTAPDEVGEIHLKRRDGWFPIKDLGHVDADGHYYHDGRADDVIISAGWTMSAQEIENTLMKHTDVDEVAVIAAPDEVRGQVAKAVVVSERDGSDAFTAELQAFAKQSLARHEYPRQVAYAAALPKTPAGKINRKALRDAEPS
ncbi:MAG: AMP-binding protein [Rhodospirillaceae bacterium]|nr:AMP-binding protein [Rhodospirillaceae bacterium]